MGSGTSHGGVPERGANESAENKRKSNNIWRCDSYNLMGQHNYTPKINEFELLEVIGQGGYGKVWKSRSIRDHKLYAIKIQSLREYRSKPEMVAQVRAERHVLETIDFPFIVRLHWAIEVDETVFLIMSYIPNGTLFNLQSNRPHQRFTEEETEFYIMEASHGLRHLHSHNICFRDLKPENLLVDERGHILLSDFGLSKVQSSPNQRHQSVVGTPEYMAPELVAHGGYSFEIDLWALGCLLYECLHGISPFSSGVIRDTFLAILKGNHHGISTSISREAADVISGLLEPDPKHRLTMADVIAHGFFKTYTWDEIFRKEHDGPLIVSSLGEPQKRIPFQKQTSVELYGQLFQTQQDQTNFCKHNSLSNTPIHGSRRLNSEVVDNKRQLLLSFIELRSISCTNRYEWAEILDERFMYTQPSNVYRKQAGSFIDDGHQKVVVGIDMFCEDLASGLKPLQSDSHVTGKIVFMVDKRSILDTEDGLVWSGFCRSPFESGRLIARTPIVVRMVMTPEEKILRITQTMDVLGFAKQLQRLINDGKAKINQNPQRIIGISDVEMLECCGQGQFGTVFKARTIISDKIIAIKSQIRIGSTLDRIKHERAIHESIDHPFVVKLIATFETQSHHFSIMEYASGGDMYQLLQRQPKRQGLEEDEVKFYMCEIFLALSHVHSKGIIYRDLKPENIIVNSEGHAKLTDFGMSVQGTDFCINNHSQIGNYEYLAPEVLAMYHGTVCGKAVDWWSFGCLMFELLTGISPFYENMITDMHTRVSKAERHALPENLHGTTVEDLISRLLVVDPKFRFGVEGIAQHPYFSGVNWADVLELKVPCPIVASTMTRNKTSFGSLVAYEEDWQFQLAQTFFKYRTMCKDDYAEWGEIVDDIFVYVNPYLPYRRQTQSDIDESTQLHFVYGIHNLVQDMESAKETQRVPVEFTVDRNEFYCTTEHAIGSLKLIAGDAIANGATKMTFSSQRKLTRVQTVFDLNAFMIKKTLFLSNERSRIQF